MKFAKTLSMCASVFALTVVALPVASSAQQQAQTAAVAPSATETAVQTAGTGILRTGIVQVEAERVEQQRAQLVSRRGGPRQRGVRLAARSCSRPARSRSW